MTSDSFSQSLIESLVVFSTQFLIPSMLVLFVLGIVLRSLIFYVMKREDWFSREFEKRTDEFLRSNKANINWSFYHVVKRLLEKTYYELFVMRAIHKKRKPDQIMALSDRIFLIQPGCAFLVRDTIKRVKNLKHGDQKPDLMRVSKRIFERNPCFTRVFGFINGSVFNDILNILPGVFIIAGIFGTFLGIMKALPELGTMDVTQVENTRVVMDQFLLQVSFAMSTSILGILLSVAMTVFNTLCSPEKLFFGIVNRFEETLSSIWDTSHNNYVEKSLAEFDEYRDALEAVAEDALNREFSSMPNWMMKYNPNDGPYTRT